VRLYHPAAHDTDLFPATWWRQTIPALPISRPLAGEADVEVAVVGGGFTGLSAAYHLARDHGVRAAVLDAGEPGWGASGRNGGFCCMGSAKLGYRAMARRFGLDAARAFFDSQVQSVDLVATLIDEHGLDVDRWGRGEFTLAHRPSRFAELAEEQRLHRELFGHRLDLLPAQAMTELGLHTAGTFGGLFNAKAFGLNPLKYLLGLHRLCHERGLALHYRTPVLKIETRRRRLLLRTRKGTLRADRLLLATNGYGRDGLHRSIAGRTLPVLSNILVTRPLSEAERAAQGWTASTPAYDSRHLLHYFRALPDGRFLFGGRGGTSAHPAAVSRLRERLTSTFRQMFPAWREVEITHFWNGLACLAFDLHPHLGVDPRDPRIAHALAYHGNGVAMGTWLGRAAAALLADRPDFYGSLPPFLRRPLPPYPLPFLRKAYLGAAYRFMEWRDGSD